MSSIRIVCGAGGVGKTTISAALGFRMAREGLRTAVLTIDPARRLADALGMPALGDSPQPVPGAPGDLRALVLDPEATFRRLVLATAGSPESAERVLQDRYYRFFSTRLTGAWEYMAMERLRELVEDDGYDTVVLDTPPARHAMEFLTAPDRLTRVLDHKVLRFLSLPRNHNGLDILRRRSSRVVETMGRLLGLDTMAEIGTLAASVEDLADGLSARVARVRELLRAPTTGFYLVTSPRGPAVGAALEFLEALEARRFPFHGFFLNRITDPPLLSETLDLSELPPAPPAGLEADEWHAVIEGIRKVPVWRAREARSDTELLERLRKSSGAPVWPVPDLGPGAEDGAGLTRLAEHLPAPSGAPTSADEDDGAAGSTPDQVPAIS